MEDKVEVVDGNINVVVVDRNIDLVVDGNIKYCRW